MQPTRNLVTSGEILWDAILNDQLEVASTLVAAGADVNMKNPFDESSSSLLHELVTNEDPRYHRLAVLVMQRGAKVDVQDACHSTPLDYAIQAECPIDVIRELLKHGARVHLRQIVEAGRHPDATEVMALLVDAKTWSRRIHDALYDCVKLWPDEREILPAVKLFLSIKLHCVAKVTMSRILLCAIRTNKVKVVQLLIEHGFDVNGSSPHGESALCAASRLDNPTITGMLLRAGAKVNYPSIEDHGKYKEYPIHAACADGSLENIRLLLRYGADVRFAKSGHDTAFNIIGVAGSVTAAHRALIRYLAISASKGLTINDHDLQIFEFHPGKRGYYVRCLEELGTMKLMNIVNDFTFFSMFRNARELAFLTRYAGFSEYYNRVQRKDIFPLYHEEMYFALEVAETRKNLLSEREKAICETLENILPHVPLERIVYYFYLNEIE